jgi:hypothetical protein
LFGMIRGMRASVVLATVAIQPIHAASRFSCTAVLSRRLGR